MKLETAILKTTTLVLDNKRIAIAFLTLKLRVKATMKGNVTVDTVHPRHLAVPPKRSSKDIVLTIGRPNYKEREFLKLCKKAKVDPTRQIVFQNSPSQKIEWS